MEIILFVGGLLLGAVITYLICKNKLTEVELLYNTSKDELQKLNAISERLQCLKTENIGYKIQMQSLTEKFEREIDLLNKNHQDSLNAEKVFNFNERASITTNYEKILLTVKESSQKEIQAIKESFEAERKNMSENLQLTKQNFDDTKTQIEKQWVEKTELLKVEFQSLATEILETKSGNLQTVNKELLDAIINPLKERIQSFETTVKNSQESGAANKASLEKAIDEVMKRAREIGEDAVNLTKALKGNNKIQGDWGEMILENILEKSGLRKNEEYFIQETMVSGEDKVRPDVIVRFPEQRSVIIDSKVSLTAYANYMECDNEQERSLHLKNHLKSIKDHIEELSNRNYSQYVEESVGYVLMFIPNEASYILAVQNNPNIGSYAYNKRIVLISPTNLMMALQLAYNLWQSERQSRNIQEIVRQGSDLYDKFVAFHENFIRLGEQITKIQKTYNDVTGQLSNGNGNLIRRVEKIRRLGLNPKKRINSKFIDDEESDLYENQ